MSASDPTTLPDDTPSQVSWQLLFLALVPLAINTMFQPSGHVCGTPRRHRTYLRSSPLICLADSISILARLSYHFIASFQNKRHGALAYTFKYRLSSFLKFRFEDHDVDHSDFESEGLKTIERMTWLRWLFFALGTLGPGVQLLAMKGIVWTKVWAVVFVVSFVVVEILLILSWNRKQLDGDFEPSYDWYNAPDSPFLKVDRILFRVACVLHVLVVFWLVAELWPIATSHQTVLQRVLTNPKFGPLERAFGRLVILCIESIFSCFLALIGSACYGSREKFAKFRPSDLTHVTNAEFNSYMFLGAVMASVFAIIHFSVGVVCFSIDAIVVAFLWAPAQWMDGRIEKLVGKWPRFCEALQITGRLVSKEQRTVVIDRTAYWYFLMFFYTVGLSIAWYATKYDPTGTENPVWTAILG